MDDTEHTRLSGFEVLKEWGDLTTLGERRFYLRRLVRHESDHKIRSADFHPGGFNKHTSNLFNVNKDAVMDLIVHQRDVLDQVWALPDNIRKHSPEWELLKKWIIPISREYKIHLQPKEEHIPSLVSRLVEMIVQDEFLQQSIVGFKCRVIFQNSRPDDKRAIIVLYLVLLKKRNQARQMCGRVLAKLKDGLAEYEACSNGRLPIYNYPVTDLMSFIQVGTDTKFQLKRILGEEKFNQLFPAKLHQSLLLDEKLEYYV